MTDALKRRSGVKDVTLNLREAIFHVEGRDGVELDIQGLKQTIETWGGYEYRVGEARVVV